MRNADNLGVAFRGGLPVMIPGIDLGEWAHGLRISGEPALADFAAEILELLDNAWMVDTYLQNLKRVEELSEKKFPGDDQAEMGKHLDALEAKLDAFEDAENERQNKRLERAEKIIVADMYAAPLEYDL